jgi:hypothetical protein
MPGFAFIQLFENPYTYHTMKPDMLNITQCKGLHKKQETS